MKIIETNAGALSNFEVLDHLRSRGAGTDLTRVIAAVSRSEYKVFDYLEQSVACNQTREIAHNFVKECQKFDLAKAEIYNIMNLRPKNAPELFTIIEECGPEQRMEDKAEELLETIMEILPPHPSEVEEANEGSAEGDEETEPAPDTTSWPTKSSVHN